MDAVSAIIKYRPSFLTAGEQLVENMSDSTRNKLKSPLFYQI